MRRQTKRDILIACAAAAILVGGVMVYKKVHIYGVPIHKDATCEEAGRVYRICRICGQPSDDIDKLPPTGHVNTEWRTTLEPTAVSKGSESLFCLDCGTVLESRAVLPVVTEYDIPTLRFNGTGRGMTADVAMRADYEYSEKAAEDEDTEDAENTGEISESIFEGTADIRLVNPGESANSKHSYSVEFTDASLPEFRGFGENSSVYLFANNDDITNSRRVVGYKQWYDIISENESAYEKLIYANGTNFGGYNVYLYIKNAKPDYSFAGTYTLSVPYTAFAAANESAGIEYALLPDKDGDAQYLYGSTRSKEKAMSELSDFFSAIDRAEFKNVISGKTDINILIDYYCFAKLTGNTGMLAYETYWVNCGGKWYPVPADTEHSYGAVRGKSKYEVAEWEPENEFWKTFSEKYSAEITGRLKRLLEGRMSPENIRTDFEVNCEMIGDDVYNKECQQYNISYRSPSEEIDKISDWYEKNADSIK